MLNYSNVEFVHLPVKILRWSICKFFRWSICWSSCVGGQFDVFWPGGQFVGGQFVGVQFLGGQLSV